MNSLLDIAKKDIRLLLRDRAAVFWVLGWPLVFAFFFGSIMSGGGSVKGMKVAVVDEDGSKVSQSFVAQLDSSSAVRVERMDLASARDAVRKGERTAYILIPEGYGETASMFDQSGSAITIGVDPSRKAETAVLHGILMQASFENMQEKIRDPVAMQDELGQAIMDVESSETLAPDQKNNLTNLLSSLNEYYENTEPESEDQGMPMAGAQIEIEEVVRQQEGRPRSGFEISFPSAIMWAMMACAATFAVSMVLERQEGTLLRLRSSPLSRGQIMAGKALACFLTSMGIIIALLFIALIFFKVRVGDFPLLVMAVISAGVCFTGLMMLLSVLGKTPRAVGGVGWATMLVFAMFGGGMIPLIAMPGWMQSASNFSPNKWAILALEGGIWRDFTFVDMLLPCGILIAVGLITFSIGVRVFSWTEA